MSTASGIVTRDLYRHFLNREASHRAQLLVGRLTVAVVITLALIVGLASGDLLVLLGGAAVSYGFQMWPALLGICYIRFFTSAGVICGLIGGLLAVTFTYVTELGGLIGIGRYPLTIHSAGWGILVNLVLTVGVSALTQPKTAAATEHRDRYHRFIARHAALPPEKRKWRLPVWGLVIVWFLFAIGPFAVLGNQADPAEWLFGIPTLWVWQIAWWICGCVMIYLLAFKLEMSTVPEAEIESLSSD